MAGKRTSPWFKIPKHSSPEVKLPLPLTTGTLLRCARARAWILSPNNSKTSGGGPTQLIPDDTSDCAKVADSERKPYPIRIEQMHRMD